MDADVQNGGAHELTAVRRFRPRCRDGGELGGKFQKRFGTERADH